MAVIVLNVWKIVRDGFQEDVREGAQRVSAAILPFAFLLYATVRSYAPHESWVELGQLIRTIPAWQLFLGSAGAGALVAAEIFHVTPTNRLLMRMLVLAQSAAGVLYRVCVCWGRFFRRNRRSYGSASRVLRVLDLPEP